MIPPESRRTPGSNSTWESASHAERVFADADHFSCSALSANCTACHAGANFTDEKYHNIGIGMDKPMPDLGRYEQTKNEKDKGAFKTPTVRNVTQTGPYMHDGSLQTLEEVIDWYDKGGHPNPYLSDKMKKLSLTEQEKEDLLSYMHALTGPLPVVCEDRLPK